MFNMNFSKRCVINTAEQHWQPSPANGVWRKPLAREQAEQGHATSIVKYEAGTSFKPHKHPKGEEIFVLEGVFSDENGNYPAGTYLRNPQGSSHAPFSKEGCIIFVKLCQFHPEDKQQVVINTSLQNWQPGQGQLQVMPLHSYATEHTALVKWPAGEKFKPHTHFGGEEILVLSGTFCDEYAHYPAGSWIRSPHLSSHRPFVEQDTIIWVKTGHLIT
ncbi:cupin domain-containing protein [Catenovulum adriaticum]|uniref:Cupin domain-containing protein n=1 Tax=Catenovulum adriaticum TaxID=2984846 RepID=A0ABY7AL25_9ALTE|nr:cupin domain-containing protein [Catenovulum sp. TS8]WAJ70020.1 cupin domain-containing protein [Catenovulum sp. TS8]